MTDFNKVREIIARLRELGIPEITLQELEKWVKQQEAK